MVLRHAPKRFCREVQVREGGRARRRPERAARYPVPRALVHGTIREIDVKSIPGFVLASLREAPFGG
jgi:hypothetical protein